MTTRDAAVEFLRRLRPAGPWVLTAIVPDGNTITQTFAADDESGVRAFIGEHDGKRNIYYSANPTRAPTESKASKANIAAVEYLIADLDPADGETAADAKARYLPQLEAFEPAPTAIIDSGNGIQCLWRLAKPVVLPDPVTVTDAKGKSKLVLSPDATALIVPIEARAAALMLRLGSKAGTQNVDRILRLPGTTNLPNRKKLKDGRVPCPANLIRFNGVTCTLDAFPPPELKAAHNKAKTDIGGNGRASVDGDIEIDIDALPISQRIKNLIRGVDDADHPYDSRSERVLAVLVAMACAGCTDEQMVAVMRGEIGQHVRDQADPVKYLERQIAKARKFAEGSSPEAKGQKLNQSKVLIAISDTAKLFHTPDGTAFADIVVNDHRETWPIRSRTFQRWLARQYYGRTGGAPSSDAKRAALGIIEAKATFDSPEQAVFVRVGHLGGKSYIDLADALWRAVEIDADGWRVINNPPIRFRRSAGMLPLPVPVRGGSVTPLRRFLNVGSDADFTLVVAWLLAALRHGGPYPALVAAGEQGSAKSTFAAIMRKLVDPNTAPLRALPREDRDLFIAATNAHVLVFDNVSGLPNWISDTLCRLATGGGFATRELYTDQDEVLFDAVRPIILNGIEDVVTRPDLADRSIMLVLEPIPDEQRRTEDAIWSEFEKAQPAIFGALLDAMAHGVRRLPETELKQLPRMADFAIWITACEEALELPCTFKVAHDANIAATIETVIEADPVAVAVRTLMGSLTEWKGTASQLLQVLGECAGETARRSRFWPSAPNKLSNRLRRAAPFLRKTGISVELDHREGRASDKIIRITTGLLLP
jgi:hypothetical protein